MEIAVEAASLNFKDVMNAMGLLPEKAVSGGLTGHRLGLEVAGRVLRTGRLVDHVRAGDGVIARVAEGFCGRATTPGHYVVRRPDALTPVRAASVPLVYVTALYSLCHLARLASGETVLIHSAAGGVGVAAIRLAHRAGATATATAGTKEKRQYLRRLGVKDVFDSRSLDFYNGVVEVTGGRGVDVVPNSLTGRFIAQGLKCLAPFGRSVPRDSGNLTRGAYNQSSPLDPPESFRMPHQVEVSTPLEALLVEQALLMARELQSAADAAPDGRVLADAELVAVRAGREFTRKALEAALQAQADGAEKKGRPPAPAAAAGGATPRASRHATP